MDHRPNSTILMDFSAACWFFAQELTDIMQDNNETVIPLGLVETAWGKYGRITAMLCVCSANTAEKYSLCQKGVVYGAENRVEK